MAQAYVLLSTPILWDASVSKDRVSAEITFTGPEIPGGYDVAYGEILFDAGDPVSQLRPKLTAVVQLEASARGFVVAKQDMFLPAVQQGV